MDEGVGIKQALSFNPNLKIKNDKDALLLSIEPGIAGKAFKYKGKMRKQVDIIWQNSGYGLFVTSEICQHGGDFLIYSGNNAVLIRNRMRLRVSRINSLNGDLIDNHS